MQLTITLPDDLIPIGTKVYIPMTGVHQVAEDQIVGYIGTLTTTQFVPSDYQLNTVNMDRSEATDNTAWKGDEFFLSYEEALAMAEYYELHVGIAVSYAAIGYIEDGDSYTWEKDNCELADCCDNTDLIRALLAKAVFEGGMTGVARNRLRQALASHERPENHENLDKILEQLKLTW